MDGVKFVDVLRIIAGFIFLVLIIVYAYLAFKAKEKDDLMEIDKLIKRLKSLHNVLKEEGEQKCSPEINTVAFVLMDAATSLSTLQAKTIGQKEDKP